MAQEINWADRSLEEKHEIILEKAIKAEENFNSQILELAKNGAFEKLNKKKPELVAPVVMMFNGSHYKMNEKIIPLLAKMADSDQINQGYQSHLFVSWNSVKQFFDEHPEIRPGVTKGSKYMDMVVQTKRKEFGDEIIPSAMKVIPMNLINGDKLTKGQYFLHHKNFDNGKEYTMPIPYDDSGTRIAKLVDYSKITPEAIEEKGAMELISEVWAEAKEKNKGLNEESQKNYDLMLKNIKDCKALTDKSTNKDKILNLYKNNYDKAIEVYKKYNEEHKDKPIEIKDDIYPMLASKNTAKDLLLDGTDLNITMKLIDNLDPNSARNIKEVRLQYSRNIVRELMNDYSFNEEYKNKYGKTFTASLKKVDNAQTQAMAR